MIRKKLKRIEQVLKYEQRLLDDTLQQLGLEINKLNQIQSQIDANNTKRQSVFTQDARQNFAIDTAQSRTQFANRLDQIEQQLKTLKSEQQQEVDTAKLAVAEQRTRVKAIETLVKKLNHEARQSQLDFESYELYDSVLAKSLEPKS